jgi:YbbR domain-containing protein
MRWGGKRLKALIAGNGVLKLFAVTFAGVLWLLVNGAQRDTEKTMLVPVELRNLSPELVVIGPRVDFVDLRVSGSPLLLGRLSSKKVILDLAGVRPGPSSFRVSTELLNLPRGVKVLRVSPSHVNLSIARIIKRTVPVRLDLAGKPPYGYVMGDVEVTPDTVEVTGPAPQVEKLEAVLTDTIDTSRLTQATTRDLNLRGPEGEFVSYSLERVHARVEVQEVIVMREFRRLKIAVKNAAVRAVPAPFLADVAVRGPQRLVEKLRLSDGEVFVDAAGQGPGTVTLPVTVLLPPEVEVVSQEPAEVELRLVGDHKKKPRNLLTPHNKKRSGA